MDEVWIGDLLYVAAFCLGGLVFALGPIVVVLLLSARKTRNYARKTEQFIECGMDPIGDAWIRYSAVYYLYALVFVAFAVDVLYLVPVALVYNRVKDFVVRDFVEMTLFVGILSLVIVYAWKKGLLNGSARRSTPEGLRAIRPICEAGRVTFARPRQLVVAADLWAGVLRDRNDGGRGVTIRPGPFRGRGVPALSAAGRRYDRRGHD